MLKITTYNVCYVPQDECRSLYAYSQLSMAKEEDPAVHSKFNLTKFTYKTDQLFNKSVNNYGVD